MGTFCFCTQATTQREFPKTERKFYIKIVNEIVNETESSIYVFVRLHRRVHFNVFPLKKLSFLPDPRPSSSPLLYVCSAVFSQDLEVHGNSFPRCKDARALYLAAI